MKNGQKTIRRAVFLFAGLLFVGWLGYFLAWNPGFLGEDGWAIFRNMAIVAVILAAFAFVLAGAPGWPRWAERLVAVVATAIGVILVTILISFLQVSWAGLGWMILFVIVLTVLSVGTIAIEPLSAIKSIINRPKSSARNRNGGGRNA